ncbi:Transcription elongation factor GreA [bioreactor metagenome]|uniref:Transcription elongation factor GreA n=1 Tax=bioreactor metagenome TaxID=1076179 RepID=A0A644Z8T1_9ZZZZ
MIKTARVITGKSKSGEIGLFDTVEVYFEEDGETQKIQIVTTLRQDAMKGFISKESPVGKALMGHRAGDRVCVEVNPGYSYYVKILAIEKGEDDESLPISTF